MKVLLINGSPHVSGCTHRALKEIETVYKIIEKIVIVDNNSKKEEQEKLKLIKYKKVKIIFFTFLMFTMYIWNITE